MDLKVSLVIPCYNEEKRLDNTLNKIIQFFSSNQYDFNLFIVDDGSNDETLEIVSKYQALHPNIEINIFKNISNKGKGFSVKKGMLSADGDIVLFTDADLSTPIEEFKKLEDCLLNKNFDIAIGSRNIAKEKRKIPQGKMRSLMGKIFSYIVRIILLPDIFDSQCGFKAFKKECINHIFNVQTIDGFGFDPEILYIAKKKRYKIKEIAVVWENNNMSKVNILKDSIFMFFNLFIIRLKFWNKF